MLSPFPLPTPRSLPFPLQQGGGAPGAREGDWSAGLRLQGTHALESPTARQQAGAGGRTRGRAPAAQDAASAGGRGAPPAHSRPPPMLQLPK